jgi:hypothetical protein
MVGSLVRPHLPPDPLAQPHPTHTHRRTLTLSIALALAVIGCLCLGDIQAMGGSDHTPPIPKPEPSLNISSSLFVQLAAINQP